MFGIKKMYDFYLAGSMRGHKDLNKPLFTLAASLLRKQGHTVWSPSEHKSYLQLSFAQVIAIDLNKVINNCRKIAFLPGWRESLGANSEAFAAFVCGKDAVEIKFNGSKTKETWGLGWSSWVSLIPVDLAEYRLPYGEKDVHPFNPHKCDLHSFS